MTIFDLLTTPSQIDDPFPVEADALTESGALVEAALLDVRLDATTAQLWLLFDCRGALQIDEGNTAIVVVHNVTELRWETVARRRRMWPAVMSWEPIPGFRQIRISAGLEPNASLEVVGSGGDFYVGNIPGGDDPPPDFNRATDDEIRRGLASWLSEIDVVGGSSL